MPSQSERTSVDFRSDLGELLFLDRYALKTTDRGGVEPGRVVVFSPEVNGVKKRAIGVVREIIDDGRRVTVETRDGESFTLPADHLDVPLELNYKDMAERVGKAIASAEESSDKESWYGVEFSQLLESRELVPAGRILAGAGAPGDLTLYNCYVLPSPHDSRQGILKTATDQFEIMSRGGGVGINVSSLRPTYDYVRGVNGRSSGAVSWADLYSIITGKVEQGGTRRGALMIILDIWHPDIIRFVQAKHEIGFLDNANISVGITSAFMSAVEADEDWDLVFPDRDHHDYDRVWDGDLNKWVAEDRPVRRYDTIKARELFRMICESAWRSAEPGLFFVDRVNEESNSHYLGNMRCCNPCVIGSTRLATDHGLVRVADLHISQSPINCTVDNRALDKGLGTSIRSAVPVFMTSPSEEVFEVKTKAGYKITATAWHDFYTTRGKIELRDLKVGDKLHVQSGKGQFGQEGSYDLGLVMGLIAGDGHFTDTGKGRDKAVLGLWGEDRVYAIDVIESVNGLLSASGMKRVREVGSVAIKDRDEERISSVKLADLMAVYGFNSDTKHRVPEVVWRGTEECARGYLRGLFQADGTVNVSCKKASCSVRLASSQREHLEEVQILLANFGILGKIYKRRDAQDRDLPDGKGGLKTYHTKTQYELIIDNTSREVFFNEIGFFDGDRRDAKYREWVEGRPLYEQQKFVTKIISITPKGREPVYDTTQDDRNAVIFNGLSTGQCGEQALPGYGVCNLGALNLSRFVEVDAASGHTFWPYTSDVTAAKERIDFNSLKRAVKTSVRFLDNVIDSTIYVSPENERQQKSERRVGLGVMGLAELFVKIGVRYGSEESVRLTDAIFKTIRDTAYEASIELSEEKGPFPAFDAKFLDSGFAKRLPDHLRSRIWKSGIRNVTLLTVAPTGTTGSMMGTSTGLEPYFSFRFEQRSNLGSNIVEEPVVKEFRAATGYTDEKLPPQFVTTPDLSPEDHVGIMATAQRFVDAAISKTMNLPHDYTVEQIETFYRKLYQLGCKGGTVYRDGSRQEQCLVQIKDDPEEDSTVHQEVVKKSNPPVRPLPDDVRIGRTVAMRTHLGRVHVTLNQESETHDFFEAFISLARGGSDVDADIGAIGRLISLVLRLDSPVSPRHRVELIADQLEGIASVGGAGINPDRTRSVPDAIAKALRKLLEAADEDMRLIAAQAAQVDVAIHQMSETKSQESGYVSTCPSCKNVSAINASGCHECRICGYSACG